MSAGTGERFVVLSGCSAGGKSTLLVELSRRGYPVVEEPGRRIIAAGGPLPWIDLAGFARRAIAMALADRAAMAGTPGWVFFDRGLVDAAAALEQATGVPALAPLATAHRYHRRVFLAPPWPDIYVTDPERPHGFDAAAAEYARLRDAYAMLGYVLVDLPRDDVAARADAVLTTLGAA